MNREICEYINVPLKLIMDCVGFNKLSLIASQAIIYHKVHLWF